MERGEVGRCVALLVEIWGHFSPMADEELWGIDHCELDYLWLSSNVMHGPVRSSLCILSLFRSTFFIMMMTGSVISHSKEN